MRHLPGFLPLKPRNILAAAVLAAVSGSLACGGPHSDPDTYGIEFTLSETPENLEKLSFDVDYDGGDFAGNGDIVACRLLDSDGDLVAVDNDDGHLSIDVDVTADPLKEDSNIVECNFLSSTQPTADDFTIRVVSTTPEVDLDEVAVVVTSTDIITTATTAP